MSGETHSPRDRMVYSAAQLVRMRGVTATGVRDVAEHARAPRGSFQHYFPGGKDQLVSEAVLWAADFAAQWAASYPRTTREPSLAGLFAHMVRQWKDEFSTRGYERGCPVMAATADLAGTASAVNEPLRAALDRWDQAVTSELVRMGVPRGRAGRLATLMIGTLEGAIMVARVRRDLEPLNTAVAELSPLLDSHAPGPAATHD
jgi:AcrR family transcriptional regulator